MQHQIPLSEDDDDDRPRSAAFNSGHFMIRLSGLSIFIVILSSVSIALFTGRIASFYLTAQGNEIQDRAECQAEVVMPFEPIEKVMNYEALVHPAMISHINPKRVGVYGGKHYQTSATLREILKHISVTKTNILGNGNKVKNDVVSDAGEDHDLFDVIIDPNPISASTNFLAYFSSLDSGGVLALNSETIIANDDPALGVGRLAVLGTVIDSLEEAGFESIHFYEDENFGTHSFLIAFKSYDSRAEWYSNEAEFNIRLRQQIGRTESLKFFDAPTMLRYQMPQKAVETVFCYDDEKDECDTEYYDHEILSVPFSDLSVGQSTMGEHSGRGIFAKDDIPKGRLIGFEKSWLSYFIYPSSHRIMMELYDWADSSDDDGEESGDVDDDEEDYFDEVFGSIAAVVGFSEGYGFWSSVLGRHHSTVDSGLMMFCNHGCNGTYNLGDDFDNSTESSVDPYHPPDFRTSPFNPSIERNLHHKLSSGDMTNRDIKKGEEILCNYLEFVGHVLHWEEDVLGLQGQCAGTELGAISDYEKEKRMTYDY